MFDSNNLYKKIQQGRFVLGGPCVIENEKMVMELAEELKNISEELGITAIFKASYDKANRTSIQSFRGTGMDKGLKILEKVKKELEMPIVTDIHEPSHAKPVSEVADILQIPAFLCRQTDLLVEASKTDKIINIKKAQFLDGKDMIYPTQKVAESGNNKIILTERGTLMGLGRLVVDFTQMLDMKEFGYPVILDATHCTQRPGGGAVSGGNAHYSPFLAKGALAMGFDSFFFEFHKNPKEALSDGTNMLELANFKQLLNELYKG